MSMPRSSPLWGRQPGKPLDAVIAAVLCLVVLGIAGGVGLALKQPWLFPSLGPTVMLFFGAPKLPSSRPVNAVVGHFVALLVGYLCVLVFGLRNAPPAPIGGLTPPYVFAGSLAVAVTILVLKLMQLPHPPAGATALIVSLGILDKPPALLEMAGAIVLVSILGWAGSLLVRRRED
jgi:CBS-domain-containing membrane protein